jgi:hypothetical protein
MAAAATTAATAWTVGPPAQVGDHEEEHHDDRPGVDEHLRGGDELGVQEQVEHGERGEVADERERRVERVGEEDDGDSRREEREGGQDPDDPDDDVPGVDLGQDHDSDFQTGMGLS